VPYHIIAVPALLIAWSSAAQAQAAPETGVKVAVVEIQSAILSTREGQKAAAEFDAKFLKDRARLEKEQADLKAAQDRLSQKRRLAWLPLRHTLIVRRRKMLLSDIGEKTKSLNRDNRQVQAEAERDRVKVLRELAPRAIVAIERFAKENGYLLVLDAGSAPPSVLSSATNITGDIVKLYDRMFSTAR
jgi:outer membrane protein